MRLGDNHLLAPTLAWELGPPDQPEWFCDECGACEHPRNARNHVCDPWDDAA